VINLCIIPDSTDTWKFHTHAVIKNVYLRSRVSKIQAQDEDMQQKYKKTVQQWWWW